MMKKVIVVFLICLLGVPLAFAQYDELPEPVYAGEGSQETPIFSSPAEFWFPNFDEVVYYLWNFDAVNAGTIEFLPFASFAQAGQSDMIIPAGVRYNQYFENSVRYTNLAKIALEEGNYDEAVDYAKKAMDNADLSDQYVELQVKIKVVNDLIDKAQLDLDWVSSEAINAPVRFSADYNNAQTALIEAKNYRTDENWDAAFDAAERVIDAVAHITELSGAPSPVMQPSAAPSSSPAPGPGTYALPAQYIVQTWAISRDCLWNIAGRPWVYNDPNQWRLLYNANRSKMPQPDNPDLIEPGMILDIPSINGEVREGMWEEGRTYVPLR